MAQDFGFLAGDPDVIASFSAQGPEPGAAPPGMASRMVESHQFAISDQQANRRLTTFATDANQGIRSYNNTAYGSSRLYLTADELSAASFSVLTDPAVQRTVTDPTMQPPRG